MDNETTWATLRLGGGDHRRLETSASSPSDVAEVRRSAAAHLQRHGCTDTSDAILVISELVTNAILHGGGAVSIRIACEPSQVRIIVSDRRSAPPSPRTDNPLIGGRGLHIVDRVADAWGFTPTQDGKSVWADVPRTPA